MECLKLEQIEEFLRKGTDADLRRQMEDHLAACSDCRRLLDQVRANESLANALAGGERDEPTTVAAAATPAPPAGPHPLFPGYTITREISRGGQGVVYQAVQQSTKRKVAIKVLREGHFADLRERARFEREVQILGQLRHANIVTVYDSGSVGGNSYYVMDYVSGQPLDDYVKDKQLAIDDTLKLFAKVCDAVHAAHLRGIIHRDLKPSNIRVDTDGQPRVLDFGLAKLAGASELTESPAMTMTGQFLGSLPWSSPEQAEGQPSKIDIRTDVYSLGVILYQLLTGKFPYEVVGNMRDVLDRILRSDPARPSTIRRQINNEIETIALKCLSKERDRRYQSAGELARDIQHYLADEPIEARRDSGWYVLKKTVQRYRLPVAVAVTLVMFVSGSAIALALMYQHQVRATNRAVLAEQNQSRARQEAVQERDRAEEQRKLAELRTDEIKQIADFQAEQLASIDATTMGVRLRADVLAGARAALQQARLDEAEIESRAAELETLLAGTNWTHAALRTLDRSIFTGALEAADKQLGEQPLVQARMFQTLAETLIKLGLHDRATDPQTRAMDIRRRVLGDEHPDTLRSINNMGLLLRDQGKLAEAEPYCCQALETMRRVLGNEHPDTLTSINNMGLLLHAQGKSAEAEPYYREALERRRRVLGDEHPQTLRSISNMGFLLNVQGKLTEAEPYFREALERRRRVLGDDHPDTLNSIGNMGGLLLDQGKPVEAEPYVREALEKRRRVLGDEHPHTLIAINNMGGLLQVQGKLGAAEPVYREALEKSRRILGDDHPDTLNSIGNMGGLLRDQGKLAEAEPYLREALEKRRRVLGDEHADTLRSINNMGNLLQAQGKLAEAEPYYREALRSRRVLGEDHPDTLKSLNFMGTLLYSQGKLAEAEPYFREALEKRRRVLGDEHPDTLGSINNMGVLLRGEGKLAEAEPYFREALTRYQEKLGPKRWETANAQMGMGIVLSKLARYGDAETHLLAAEVILRTAQGVPRGHYGRCVQAVVELYDQRQAAEPDEGYDQKAAEWRAKLNELQAATQPASAPRP